MVVVSTISQKYELSKKGFRTVIDNGDAAC
jgi:hypothetical protein